MEARQIELLNLMVKDMGLTVTQAGEKEEARFFSGYIETPENNQKFLSLVGIEVTHFFKRDALIKTAEQLSVDINTWLNNNNTIMIKFSVYTKWWVYSSM